MLKNILLAFSFVSFTVLLWALPPYCNNLRLFKAKPIVALIAYICLLLSLIMFFVSLFLELTP
jgi:hypothetical protein